MQYINEIVHAAFPHPGHQRTAKFDTVHCKLSVSSECTPLPPGCNMPARAPIGSKGLPATCQKPESGTGSHAAPQYSAVHDILHPHGYGIMLWAGWMLLVLGSFASSASSRLFRFCIHEFATCRWSHLTLDTIFLPILTWSLVLGSYTPTSITWLNLGDACATVAANLELSCVNLWTLTTERNATPTPPGGPGPAGTSLGVFAIGSGVYL
jgi:hypothetical protein